MAKRRTVTSIAVIEPSREPSPGGHAGRLDKYRAQNDADLLMHAEQIKKDRSRYDAALACLRERHDDTKSAIGRGKRASGGADGSLLGQGYRRIG